MQYNDNVNVKVNVKDKDKDKEKEKGNEYVGDIKKEKNFLFAGGCANDFFNVFNG